MRACKKSAPYDPIWPRLAPLALLATFGHVRHFLALFGPVWPSLAPFDPVCHHFAPFGPAWPYLTPFGLGCPCLAPLGPVWPRSGAARIVLNCVELNIFMIWDGCTLNHFVIYYFDEKYQCLLNSYKLIVFQQKQEQQQPLMNLERGVIVKICKS